MTNPKKPEETKKKITTASSSAVPVKKWTPEEAKDLIITCIKIPGDLETRLKEFSEEILPKYVNGKGAEKDQAWKELDKKVPAVLIGLETQTHYALAASFVEDYRGLTKELCDQLMKEYKCTTVTEKMLVEMAVNGFIRTLENSKRLNNCLEAGEHLSSLRTSYLGMMSKQIDRSQRQYLSAITTLKQIKSPSIEMNIKTNTTFIAQNQQINAGDPAKPENNEPK